MAKRPASRPLRAERKERPESTRVAVPASMGAPPARPAAAPTAPPSAPPAQPPTEALSLFQHGMEAMQRHAYVDAGRAFQGILMGFPAERALGERATVYLALCEREANRKPAGPRTIEERLTAATAALNNDNDAQAEELARSVLGDDPKHDLALYLLAAVHARRGDTTEALSLLGKVLAITPEASAQARADADFENLQDFDEFWTMTEPPQTPHTNQARRGRRLRGER
jgi:tetratricopeptide (TPR) repeat protein